MWSYFANRRDVRRVEKISRACVFLHQNRELSLGNNEASLRVALTEGLRIAGMDITYGHASPVLIHGLDKRDDRVYLIADKRIVLDVLNTEVIEDHDRHQFDLILQSRPECPVGLLVNFGREHYEPEIEEFINRNAK